MMTVMYSYIVKKDRKNTNSKENAEQFRTEVSFRLSRHDKNGGPDAHIDFGSNV